MASISAATVKPTGTPGDNVINTAGGVIPANPNHIYDNSIQAGFQSTEDQIELARINTNFRSGDDDYTFSGSRFYMVNNSGKPVVHMNNSSKYGPIYASKRIGAKYFYNDRLLYDPFRSDPKIVPGGRIETDLRSNIHLLHRNPEDLAENNIGFRIHPKITVQPSANIIASGDTLKRAGAMFIAALSHSRMDAAQALYGILQEILEASGDQVWKHLVAVMYVHANSVTETQVSAALRQSGGIAPMQSAHYPAKTRFLHYAPVSWELSAGDSYQLQRQDEIGDEPETAEPETATGMKPLIPPIDYKTAKYYDPRSGIGQREYVPIEIITVNSDIIYTALRSANNKQIRDKEITDLVFHIREDAKTSEVQLVDVGDLLFPDFIEDIIQAYTFAEGYFEDVRRFNTDNYTIIYDGATLSDLVYNASKLVPVRLGANIYELPYMYAVDTLYVYTCLLAPRQLINEGKEDFGEVLKMAIAATDNYVKVLKTVQSETLLYKIDRSIQILERPIARFPVRGIYFTNYKNIIEGIAESYTIRDWAQEMESTAARLKKVLAQYSGGGAPLSDLRRDSIKYLDDLMRTVVQIIERGEQAIDYPTYEKVYLDKINLLKQINFIF